MDYFIYSIGINLEFNFNLLDKLSPKSEVFLQWMFPVFEHFRYQLHSDNRKSNAVSAKAQNEISTLEIGMFANVTNPSLVYPKVFFTV
jgi:hypothetical protein